MGSASLPAGLFCGQARVLVIWGGCSVPEEAVDDRHQRVDEHGRNDADIAPVLSQVFEHPLYIMPSSGMCTELQQEVPCKNDHFRRAQEANMRPGRRAGG